MTKLIRVVGGVLAAVLLAASPAWSAVSMTVSPPSTVSWSLSSSGANSTSGGSFTVSANEAYTVTVTADKTRLSEYASGAYVPDGKALGAPLFVDATRTGGTAVVPGIGVVAEIGSTSTLATGTGGTITSLTDQYSITLSQETAITDPALPEGRTYHIVLTYTASAAL
jgi:hypothetical protein